MKRIKKLTGKLCYLSPAEEQDAPLFLKWINDPNVTQYTEGLSNYYNLIKESEFIQKAEHVYTIVLLEKDVPIGNIAIMDIHTVDRRAEIGIMIGEEEYQGRGYGTEAMRLMLDYGFGVLNLQNIMLEVFAFNERAIHVYKKIGFREIGRRRKAHFLGQKYYDIIFMDILAGEWTSPFLKDQLGH